MTIEQYLDHVATFAGDQYGSVVRSQFKDLRGTSELGMLACPTEQELAQLRRAVAIMTAGEKESADSLTDAQIQRIAADADVDAGSFAIFINGYALRCRKSS